MSETIGFNPSFDVVLTAASGGDTQAFEQLYGVLHRRVYAFARVRGSSDPEGVVNDVFLQVFRNLSSFVGNESQFKAWVFKIARHRVIDEGRRRRRRPTEVFDAPLATEALTAVDDVEAEAVEHMHAESLLSYLDDLTSDQRDVLILRIVSDLTVETIAEILGKQTGAVKALQRRALRSLARKMVADGRTPTGSSIRSRC